MRDGFPTSLTLRVHRALSWLGRASEEEDDADVRFILLWIAFNAAYASDIDAEVSGDRERFKLYFKTLIDLDSDDRIYALVWSRFSNEVRLLLGNRYVFAPFWSHQNGVPGNADWQDRLARSKNAIGRAIASHDTPTILSILFDRLYVLRNQLIHGGATWCSRVNRDQVRDGSAILVNLVPIFIDIMMDNPDHPWGMPFYPVVE
ncbi:HEPN domain-containing protein [Sphingomonas sp. LY160]|uniref:HEPN domain-containing protein n=1 Tax=Sphingomonas sp. LY160 TaxID=3095342 RepID=UPI002ADEC7C1|nr:HEPN domain-containing protein [Sphingomonas sp. LY160]MEA1071736.1 HEPN domain-containing protein [Sphingomonas sp. LY160]